MSNEQILNAFGKNVYNLRRKLNLSQEQLAELAQLDRTYISSVERGKRNVSLLNIYKLAVALDVLPEALLSNFEEVNDAQLDR
ncbi:TPA: helix-turn-helix domain-containing protein [Providencia alcalifaciens]